MTQVTFSPSIKTRPVYASLQSQGDASAILLCEGDGALAILDLAARDASVLGRAHLIHIPAGTAHGPRLRALGAGMYHEAPSFEALAARYGKALSDATMSTRLYLAGTEGLIAKATAAALAAGLPHQAIQAEHRGSIARRMQCVHCKGVTEDVTTDPFTCSHCGLTLFVRDHFSRRLGAFQGVCVDAETPGDVPATQEIRP